MNYLQGFRDPKLAHGIVAEIKRTITRPWAIMEICGGQTHAIMRSGLDQLLPPEIELLHGPGCPVCVTPLELIDKALVIASTPGVIFTSYGDMLRVPGTNTDLFAIRAAGGDVRTVYSPIDALRIAAQNPDKQVVFFAIGFETTAPANAMSVLQAHKLGLNNFSILVSHVCVPPVIRAILSSSSNRVQAFLAAGHVCAVMGYWEYIPIAKQYQIPMVVTGFEPVDILHGIMAAVRLLENKEAAVENAYSRVVSEEGNQSAQAVIRQVFHVIDRKWRGIGLIPGSGLGLRPEYSTFDAENRFSVGGISSSESPLCIAGQVLQGNKKPQDCTAFGLQCTPEHPLGATMVSSEGVCAAYFQYHNFKGSNNPDE